MRVFIAVAVFAIAIASAIAAEKGGVNRIADDSVAAADFSRDVIVWEPMIEFRQATLRVSGESGVFERSFEPGEAVYFDFIDAAGNRLLDGSYNYELTFSPVLEAVRDDQANAGIEGRVSHGQRMVQSGSFTIADGMVALPDVSEESISFRTFVDTMDRVVQGSLCVGVDCPNAPSFGFDTVRLQENNLRIHFDDTSNSGSFPNNDWRFTANDSANGGANRFSIDDATAGRSVVNITAGAPSNSLFISSAGRIGNRTSTPAVEFHIADGDTPTVRLEQNGSSGFAAQTWDLAGNETNFFVRDVTNGSKLPFKIFPNAPNNSLTIEGSTGDIGVGTTSPDANVHIVQSGGAELRVEDTGSAAGRTLARFVNNGNTFIRLETGTTGGNWAFGVEGANFEIDKQDDGGTNQFTFSPTGDLTIQGNISKGGGSFKIDHPLDPENKFLSHSFVESPDMMNIYNGIARLGEDGAVWVELPEWFDALNRDFRYQLTAIGASAPGLYVAEEISDNRFRIAGGEQGAKVSWQVTGIRQDAYANAHRIQVEEEKPLEKRGTYLHPDVFKAKPERQAEASESKAKRAEERR